MTNKERIKKLKEIGQKATEGPWDLVLGESDGGGTAWSVKRSNGVIVSSSGGINQRESNLSYNNTLLAIEARNNWDWLLQQAQEGLEAKEKLEELTSTLGRYLWPNDAKMIEIPTSEINPEILSIIKKHEGGDEND